MKYKNLNPTIFFVDIVNTLTVAMIIGDCLSVSIF